jgi:hypothetical protein
MKRNLIPTYRPQSLVVAALPEANTRLRELAGQRNESAVKFNPLATNHNSGVDELTAAPRAKAQTQSGE